MPADYPDRSFEDALFAEGYQWILGVDEVGRGCIAGPVGIGVAAMEVSAPAWPSGLRDSKLVSEKKRVPLRDEVANWLPYNAVGFSSAEEIESIGINKAQALAGEEAVKTVIKLIEGEDDLTLSPKNTIILLDGSANWLQSSLHPFKVLVKTKADRDCVVVAAASILAKVARDKVMIELDGRYPGYGFASHKGYGSASHYDSIKQLGMIEGIHRKSWIK